MITLWKVDIIWEYSGLVFYTQRAVIHDNWEVAKAAALESVRADRADAWQCAIFQVDKLEDFTLDAQELPVIFGGGKLTRELFQ